MITAIYPGSFDPITLGHKNIIKRASRLVDKLYVAPVGNSNKKNVFSIDERILHVKKVVNNIENVEVVTFVGLLMDYVVDKNITFIIKGVRNNSDFDNEFQMATGIHMVNNAVETLFIPTDVSLLPISSSLVRDMASCKGDLQKYLPQEIIDDVKRKYNYL